MKVDFERGCVSWTVGALLLGVVLAGCDQKEQSGTKISACESAVRYLIKDPSAYRYMVTKDLSKTIASAIAVEFEWTDTEGKTDGHEAVCHFVDTADKPGFRFSRVKIDERFIVQDRMSHLNFQLKNSKW